MDTLDNLMYDMRMVDRKLDEVRRELSLLRSRCLMRPDLYPPTMRQGLAEEESRLYAQERSIRQKIDAYLAAHPEEE